jgi:hypothetical protein
MWRRLKARVTLRRRPLPVTTFAHILVLNELKKAILQ